MTDANTFAGKDTLLEWKEINQLSGRIWRSITSPNLPRISRMRYPLREQHGVPGDPQFGSGIKIGRDEWKFWPLFPGKATKELELTMGDGQ
jgi:hypothetical protein